MKYLRLGVHHYVKLFLLLLLFFLLFEFSASAGDVTVAWDANSESDLAGYTLFYGTASGNYPDSIDVGNSTQHTLSGLVEGTTYYFAVKAYDTSDNQSDFSQELLYTLPSANSAPNTPVIPAGPSNGFVQTNYSYNTSGTDPDGDLLTYRLDWGDGNISAWGGADSRTHSFSSAGIFCIKAQSQDPSGAASPWSQCLNVSIVIQRHTISASAGSNGSISPVGTLTVNDGADQAFLIQPDQYYRVADVVVDGSSVGGVTAYTFENVDRGHSIAATFVRQNQPPVVNAGADSSVRVSDTVQLDGSASSDLDGDSLTYAWSILSRPGGSTAALSNPTAVRPFFVADVAGSYTVQLIVNDGTVNSAPDTVTISTENSAPSAHAGADQTVRVNETAQLNGSNSSDVDGDSLTFAWSLVSRPGGSTAALSNPTAVRPFFVADVAGSYTVRLIVSDGTASSAPDTVTISTQNSAPAAHAGADQTVRVNETAQLNGSKSSDVDGDGLTYAWSILSRPAGSVAALSDPAAVRPAFVADVAGSYTVQLIVNDGTANSAPDTVTISTQNSAPAAHAGADQTVRVDETAQLNGSNSSDVDGDSLTFAWSLVSRPAGSSAALSDPAAVRPAFVADVAGSYTVQLIVSDGTVNSQPDTVTISTENSAPLAHAGADQTVRVDETAQLDGSASSDVDGDNLSFAWSILSRPNGSSAALSDSAAVRPSLMADVAGSYTVQLIVNDGTAHSAPDTLTISTENSTPAAYAGADQAIVINDTVQLDGSGSSDADGDNLTFTWSILSKPAGSAAALSDPAAVRPAFVADAAGSYTLQLIVSDGTASSAPDTVTISTENSVPVSEAGDDQVARVNDTVQLDGSGSSDADGDSLTFVWSLVSRPGGSSAALSDPAAVNPSLALDAVGTYTVQLIVNDGTDNSLPNSITIVVQNAAPVSNAGNDQAVAAGDLVTLSGLNSTDPDNNIDGYSWEQTGGTPVTLSNSTGAETTFIAPNVAAGSELLTFQLTVRDTDGLQDVDTCGVEVTRAAEIDSDGDGVPDSRDAFPYDPAESLDTDGDGMGNQADTDDDNDGMPDSWEITYGLDPLVDDAAADPDGDEVSNINEYNLGTAPDHYEGNFKPETPVILLPENTATVSLTPLIETADFSDPNIQDVHSKTQWKVTRAFDDACVFDVTTAAALTSMVMPNQILEEDTEYVWQVRFFDNHDTPSEWSAARDFITEITDHDTDGNGVPDQQEVSDKLDLDEDGTTDLVQSDIKCVSVKDGADQICISIRDAENVVSIVSLSVEDPNDPQLVSRKAGKPNFFEFGMLDFKLLVNNPGDETTVKIYLSRAAYRRGRCFKYDPVNAVWFDYSDYTEFSPNRKELYLTLKDGGFGDADGIENGIIVDPLAFGSDSDPNSDGSGSPIDEIVDEVIPNGIGCFIGATTGGFSRDGLNGLRLGLRSAFGLLMILVLALWLYGPLADRRRRQVSIPLAGPLPAKHRESHRPRPGVAGRWGRHRTIDKPIIWLPRD